MKVLLVMSVAGSLLIGMASLAVAQGGRGSGGSFRGGQHGGHGFPSGGFGGQRFQPGFRPGFGGFAPPQIFVPEPVVVERPVFVPQEQPSQPIPPVQAAAPAIQPAANEPVSVAKALTAGYYTITGMGTAYLQPSTQPGVYIITQIAPTASGKIYSHGYYTVSGLGTAYIQPSQTLISGNNSQSLTQQVVQSLPAAPAAPTTTVPTIPSVAQTFPNVAQVNPQPFVPFPVLGGNQTAGVGNGAAISNNASGGNSGGGNNGGGNNGRRPQQRGR